MSSDSQPNQSQSDFAHLDKLNPDDSQQNSSSLSRQPNMITEPNNPQQKMSQAKLPQLPSLKAQIMLPKKQLTLVKESKPRLIIDHMILKNFKSYAGVQKIGPFHKNFTSIVGPNGSGKSNLIESMLFIFGFNASWMRLNKLQQLIHNSSSATNVSSAAVEVHFKRILDNSDGSVTQIPDSHFFIRRTVNSTSVSKYYLNGNDSTQAQVKARLKSQGIDLTNNRFLILQGEVQLISHMKQKSGDRDKPGFLQYLEDIIGSNQFIDRIQESVKEYNTNEQTKHQKGERMKLVENQLKGMNSQKEQAIRYVKKERKLFQIESVLQQVLRSNSAFELKRGRDKIDELERRKQAIIRQEKQKMAKQADRVRQIRRLREQKEKYQKQNHRDNSKMGELSAEDKNLKGQIAYNSEDQVKYEKKIDEINAQFSKIIEQSDSINKFLPQKQQKLAQLKQQLDELKAQLSKHDKPQLREKIKNFQNEIKKTNHQRTAFNDKCNTLKNQVGKMQQNKHGHQHKVEDYKIQLKENMQIKAKIQIALEVAGKQFKVCAQQYEHEKRERFRLKQQSDSIQIMIKEKSSQRLQQGQFNNMFNNIMKANIPGVLGRLGDLGEISKQYDDVITTACSRLDNIVTETFQAASRVLNLLKNNKLGRATCIILQKIPQFHNFMNRPFAAPQGTVRLFDMIKPTHESVRVAFYFALSNTLYCQNVDLAMKIALGDDNNRRRVIARKVKGFAVYEMNGVINTYMGRRGGFDKKVAQQKKLNEKEDKQLENRHQQLMRMLEGKNQVCRELQGRLKMYQGNFQTMRSQKVVSEGKIRDITEQLKDLQVMIGRNKGKMQSIQNMQKEIIAIEQQIQKISSHLQSLQQGLKKVQDEQKKSQTAQISQMRERYKSLRQQFSKLQKEVQKQQVLISTVEKRIRQNQGKKQNTKKSIQKLQNMIEKTKKDMERIEAIGMQLINAIQNNNRKIAELVNREEEIKKLLDLDQANVKESKDKIQQAKTLVDNAKREIRKAEEDFKFSNTELQRIRKLYKDMTSTYDFLSDIEEIQKMNLDKIQAGQSSMLDMTIQNTSLEMDPRSAGNGMSTNKKSNQQNQSRILDLKRIEKVDPHQDLSQDQLDAFLLMQQKLRGQLGIQSKEVKNMQGKNLQVISEYKLKFTEFKQKFKQFEEVREKLAQLKRQINQLKEQRFQMFRQGFSMINSKLKQVYQLLTNGGDAEMELIDSLDPFSDGVNFSVRPPKKAWKQINKLSGGEKTLSSLSLIFALHYYKPTPLYFMDEIDAALDFKNVSIVGEYIKKRTKDAQFIIISLRNNMFDLADKLVGVYKTFDQTKVINLAAAKFLAKKQLSNEQEKQKEKKEKQNQNENMPRISQT